MSRFHQNCWKLLETNQESLLGHVTLRVRFHTLGCIIIRNMYVHVRECINPLTLPAAARLKRPPSCGCTPRSQYWGRRTAFHSRDIQLRVLLGKLTLFRYLLIDPLSDVIGHQECTLMQCPMNLTQCANPPPTSEQPSHEEIYHHEFLTRTRTEHFPASSE